MNLYNIYNSENGMRVGQKRTEEQIMSLFGVGRDEIKKAVAAGNLICGKYRLEPVIVEHTGQYLREEDLKVMYEWDQVTEKARVYMAHLKQRRHGGSEKSGTAGRNG